jgi:hypothetical protein
MILKEKLHICNKTSRTEIEFFKTSQMRTSEINFEELW